MSFLDRIKPRYQLRVRSRGPDGLHGVPVTLGVGDTYNLNDELGRPVIRVKFRGSDGIEVVQLAPFASFDPAAMRRWGDFVEEETRAR